MDAAVDAATDWRAWLTIQLQFKRHADFVAMERTGENAQRVLEMLRARLRSPHDRAVVDHAVGNYCASGGSLRGGIYKALEALTQRHCPLGTRRKLQDEMDTLHKHQDMSVVDYTVVFHQLLDMYNLLPLQEGPTLSPVDFCRLYSSGMPSAWQDSMTTGHTSVATISELEAHYKRLERGERADEASRANKRRRFDYASDGRSTSLSNERRAVTIGCSYCREHFYGHVYKTHNDDKCYKNPTSKYATGTMRYVPRGKCTAVFGPGAKKAEEDRAQSPPLPPLPVEPRAVSDQGPRSPIVNGSDKVFTDMHQSLDSKAVKMGKRDSVRDTTTAPASSDSVVKDEPDTSTKNDSVTPPDVIKSDPCKPTSTPVKSASTAAASETSLSEDGTTPKPWESVLLAILGPFGQTDWCVLVLVDAATQIVELCPVVHSTSEEITHAIDYEWLSRYPWPARFIYSARVPAYDPTFSHLKGRCGAYGTTPKAEPAPTNMLSVLLLHLHLSIEMRVMEMQPQSHTDWTDVLCVVRLDLRTNNLSAVAPTNPTVTSMNGETTTDTKNLKQDPLASKSSLDTPITNDPPSRDRKGATLDFAPDDMVLVEYCEMRRYVGQIPRREGPYRVEAVRSNGILVIDKGKYLEHIHSRRAVRAGSIA